MEAKHFIFIIVFLLFIPVASPITLQDLIDFFNFDFSTTTINVTAQNDFMIDKNNNNINDTLIIELTTDGNAGNYFFVLDLYNNENIITNETNKTLSSSDKINISFSTELLTKNKFNYSIKIYDDNLTLKYRKDNLQTNTYSNYEKGISIINIADKSINNSSILINLTLNITNNGTYEIFSYLKYNKTIIFSKINKTLNEGIQNTEIYFGNETIKNTHYAGNFNLTSIKINNKIIKTNYLTLFYDYKDFAQTSYFLNFLDNGIDINNDRLFDYLRLNFSIEIKNSGTFEVELALRDLFNNFIIKENKTNFFNVGTNNFILNLNGTKIYDKKLNGPYILSYIKLIKNSEIIDQLNDFYITADYNYTNFEKPLLPDLIVDITASGNNDSGIYNVYFNVTLKNAGTDNAFNIFLEIFDNNSFSANKSVNVLPKDNEITYNFNLINTNNAKISAVVDFDDIVEEINESNNIAEKIINSNEDDNGQSETASTASSSGGGGSSPITCTELWQCSIWSECINNIQTRNCSDINGCGTGTNKPMESQSCTPIIEAEEIEASQAGTEEESTNEKSQKKEEEEKTGTSLSQITGLAAGNAKPNKAMGGSIIVLEVLSGLWVYFYFVKTYKI